ncbi:MAG: HpcH/HpaI aldolase/citrate lyase family protein [Chloroflexota bacterium]
MSKPLRSLLFAPGNQPRKLARIATFGSDAVILDLEDAVPISEKESTRPMVREALPTLAAGPARYVRVNALETGLTRDDLEGVFCKELDGIKLPKVEDPGDVLEVDQILQDLEGGLGLVIGSIDLIPTIETARGVLNAQPIAAASPRVKRLSFGAADFCRDIGVRFGGNLWEADGLELQYARSYLVLASRAAGIEPPLDTVWIDIRDNAGLEQDARNALRIGFQGKSAIYPGQVEIINRVFSPTAEELDFARKVVSAFAEAESQGAAAIQVEGRMVDYPIAVKARWVLDRAAQWS